jgi:hypothetical protein
VKVKRHLFHHEGMTDLASMRKAALTISSTEPVILHLHEYDEMHDGCLPGAVWETGTHEVYRNGAPTSPTLSMILLPKVN